MKNKFREIDTIEKKVSELDYLMNEGVIFSEEDVKRIKRSGEQLEEIAHSIDMMKFYRERGRK